MTTIMTFVTDIQTRLHFKKDSSESKRLGRNFNCRQL